MVYDATTSSRQQSRVDSQHQGQLRGVIRQRESLHVSPSTLPVGRVERRLVRMAKSHRAEPRMVLVSPTDGSSWLLAHHLVNKPGRNHVWLGIRLAECTLSGCWKPTDEEVVIKESGLRQYYEYGVCAGEEDPLAELATLRALRSPGHNGVIRLRDAFLSASRSRLFVILPFVRGKDLFQMLKDTNKGRGLGEYCTRNTFRQVVESLLYMKREHRLRHGDISPENVLISPRTGHATLIDFGMAAKVPTWGPQDVEEEAGCKGGVGGNEVPRVLMAAAPRQGKRQYMPREIYEELPHDPWAPDVWSLGVTLYVALTGCAIYKTPGDSAYKAVCRGDVETLMTDRERNGSVTPISQDVKDLIAGMLRVDMEKRLTLEEVLRHPWMGGGIRGGVQKHMVNNDPLEGVSGRQDSWGVCRSKDDNAKAVAGGGDSKTPTSTDVSDVGGDVGSYTDRESSTESFYSSL